MFRWRYFGRRERGRFLIEIDKFAIRFIRSVETRECSLPSVGQQPLPMAVVNFVTEPIIYCSKCERNRDLDEIDQVYHFDAVSNNTGTGNNFNHLRIFMTVMFYSLPRWNLRLRIKLRGLLRLKLCSRDFFRSDILRFLGNARWYVNWTNDMNSAIILR